MAWANEGEEHPELECGSCLYVFKESRQENHDGTSDTTQPLPAKLRMKAFRDKAHETKTHAVASGYRVENFTQRKRGRK